MNDRFRGRRSMKKKIVFILSLSFCMILLGGCSEAKQEKQKTNNPIAYTSTEFETTEIPAQEESYVLHASKIHYKEPNVLETAINNIKENIIAATSIGQFKSLSNAIDITITASGIAKNINKTFIIYFNPFILPLEAMYREFFFPLFLYIYYECFFILLLIIVNFY